MALGLIVHDVFTAEYFSHVDVHNSGIKKVKNIKKHTDLMTTIPMAFIQQTIFMRSRLIILEQQQ